MARFVNVPNLRGVGIHEHEAYCCPIPPSPRRRHRRSSPPLPPNCVGAHSLLLCLNPRSQTYNVWFKLCLSAWKGAGKGHGLRHEGTCDFGSSKMPKCLRNFIRTVTFTQCNKCICDAPELGAGTLSNQWGQRWLFLQACVFPMEVSYHLYCDVFFGMRGDKGRGQWYVLSMTCAAGPEVLLVKMVAFESSTLLWERWLFLVFFCLGLFGRARLAGMFGDISFWHVWVRSTQNRKDGKHGNIMGTFITQHSLNRFLFRRWRIRSRFALAGPIWGNSKTTAVCCVYANNFWYFLMLSHFTQYTHLRFSIPHFGVVFSFHFLFLPDLVVVAEIQELQRFQTGEPLTCLVMAPGGLEAPDGVGVEHVAKDVHYKNIWNYQSWNPSWGLPKNRSQS